jgi:hypothetical protein
MPRGRMAGQIWRAAALAWMPFSGMSAPGHTVTEDGDLEAGFDELAPLSPNDSDWDAINSQLVGHKKSGPELEVRRAGGRRRRSGMLTPCPAW